MTEITKKHTSFCEAIYIAPHKIGNFKDFVAYMKKYYEAESDEAVQEAVDGGFQYCKRNSVYYDISR